jgi:nicotinamidase-related amidase
VSVLFVGQPVLVVVDIQGHLDVPTGTSGIPHMGGYDALVANAARILAAARAGGVPVVFLQEVHRRSGIDFGRELDGAEGIHCVEGDLATGLHPDVLPLPDEPLIVKRRYSGFIGTDLDIVLRGLSASTLVLIGGLTDVCVHYTFADAHQRDYHVCVVTDCVAGSSRAAHDASLNAMEYLQTGARRSTDEIVAAFAPLPTGAAPR